MSKQYFIRSRGTVRGPFSAERLKEMARRGQFGRAHHVSVDGVNWEPAANHPELLPEAKAVKIRKQPVEANAEEGGYELAAPDQPQVTAAAPNAPATDSVPQDNTAWYYASAGREVGPVSFADLKQLVMRGELQYNDPVWTEGMPNWMEASSVKGLFAESAFSGITVSSESSRRPAASGTKAASSQMAMIALISGILIIVAVALLFVVFAMWQSEDFDVSRQRRTPPRPSASPQEMSEEEACAQIVAGCGGCGGCLGFAVVCLIAIVALDIALLVWVARDAKARGMDSAVLWMLLVMFASLFGLLIYLFSRPQGNLLQCPTCGNKRLQASARCPHCGNP
ncbi:MAG: DUF4339 domain-containing protein [Pirellulaceae bacterium]|nr:DUF4339 domain-containing protein [Pirellulaceae bacterium]